MRSIPYYGRKDDHVHYVSDKPPPLSASLVVTAPRDSNAITPGHTLDDLAEPLPSCSRTDAGPPFHRLGGEVLVCAGRAAGEEDGDPFVQVTQVWGAGAQGPDLALQRA